jgi:hypothetical protein
VRRDQPGGDNLRRSRIRNKAIDPVMECMRNAIGIWRGDNNNQRRIETELSHLIDKRQTRFTESRQHQDHNVEQNALADLCKVNQRHKDRIVEISGSRKQIDRRIDAVRHQNANCKRPGYGEGIHETVVRIILSG